MDKLDQKLKKLQQHSLSLRILHDDEDEDPGGPYFCYVIEFPGCSVNGMSINDVLQKIQPAMIEHVEELQENEYAQED